MTELSFYEYDHMQNPFILIHLRVTFLLVLVINNINNIMYFGSFETFLWTIIYDILLEPMRIVQD
jgi:hypothetical protein